VFFLAVVVLVTPLLFGSVTTLAWELAVVLVRVDRGAVRVPRFAGEGGRTAARAMAAKGRALLLLLSLLRVVRDVVVRLIVVEGTMHSWQIRARQVSVLAAAGVQCRVDCIRLQCKMVMRVERCVWANSSGSAQFPR
jgi:hypothetical protein